MSFELEKFGIQPSESIIEDGRSAEALVFESMIAIEEKRGLVPVVAALENRQDGIWTPDGHMAFSLGVHILTNREVSLCIWPRELRRAAPTNPSTPVHYKNNRAIPLLNYNITGHAFSTYEDTEVDADEIVDAAGTYKLWWKGQNDHYFLGNGRHRLRSTGRYVPDRAELYGIAADQAFVEDVPEDGLAAVLRYSHCMYELGLFTDDADNSLELERRPVSREDAARATEQLLPVMTKELELGEEIAFESLPEDIKTNILRAKAIASRAYPPDKSTKLGCVITSGEKRLNPKFRLLQTAAARYQYYPC